MELSHVLYYVNYPMYADNINITVIPNSTCCYNSYSI